MSTTLSSGMSRAGQTVSAGSELDILAGGISISGLIDGTEVLRGGIDSAGTVAAGGLEVVASGGMALANVVAAGGAQTVSGGGVASGNVVVGAETVPAGGVTSGTTVRNGPATFGAAIETVSGSAVQTTVSSGGTLRVASGGSTTGSIVSAYGQEIVASGGSALLGGTGYAGTLTVQSGGTVTSALINGTEIVLGVDSASTVDTIEVVSSGGETIGGTVLHGALTIYAGGIASGTTVSSVAVDSGGATFGLQVASNGTLELAGGTASGTAVADGGMLVVGSGGATAGTVLGQPGVAGAPGAAVEQVLAGGAAVGTVVGDFGQQLVSGGLTTGTVVQSGGTQIVTGGGALNDTVSAGGLVVDDAVLGYDQGAPATVSLFAGTLTGSGSLVEYGPGTLALAGDLSGFTGSVVIGGGSVGLASATAAGGASIGFTAGAAGTLVVAGDAPANTILGFAAGDAIDLAALAFPAGGITVSTSGNVATFTTNGAPVTFADGSVASLAIAGAGSALLVAESDGASGTEIASLGSFGAVPNGGITAEITGNVDGFWTVTESAGASLSFEDGSYPAPGSLPQGAPFTLPGDRPAGTIIQSGPGTLILPGYEVQPIFGGTVEIAGGTVETTAAAGAGVTGFDFVSGTTGTLLLTGLDEVEQYHGYGSPQPSPAQLPSIGGIAPGDVIDFGFIPYTSALGLSVTAGSVALTSGGAALQLPNTTPVALTQTTAISLAIDGADYTYSLADDGSGGTALTVTGDAPGFTPPVSPPPAGTDDGAGPPFGDGTVPDGGVSYDIISYTNGDVGIDEAAGTTLSYTSAVFSAAELIQSGPGTLYLNSGTGGASAVVISGGTVELGVASALNGASIVFAGGASGTLGVDEPYFSGNIYTGNPGFPTDVISGLAAGDAIVLHPYLVNAGALGLSIDGDTVTLTQNGSPLPVVNVYDPVMSSGVYSLDIAGASALPFTLTSEPNGVVLSVACYARDTLILTERGERAVQELAIGDRVITVSGAAEPVHWIGRRSYAGRFLSGRREVLPILFRAGSLGQGLPRRDLRVSPSHAMVLDGFLVPARHLVNGTTITQEVAALAVEYFHVELGRHDAIWAEGAASETFIDDDSRGMFHNAADYAACYPDAGPAEAPAFYAPRLESGYELEAIRCRLAQYALAA